MVGMTRNIRSRGTSWSLFVARNVANAQLKDISFSMRTDGQLDETGKVMGAYSSNLDHVKNTI